IQPSSRKYPYVGFEPEREIGNDVLIVENLSKTIDGIKVLGNITFHLKNDDKVAFLSKNDVAITTLFKIITGEMEADRGHYKWGITTNQTYLPRDTSEAFSQEDQSILDWLFKYAKTPEEH
ncbi:ABC-F family ATPase, partial [Veillonellaceae bacterium M2-4]|nr:ABC-F family ATPase [Veillonellaceae bacterium M2-4]